LIKDARTQTGEEMVSIIESTYIVKDIMKLLGLHEKVKTEFTLLNSRFCLIMKDFSRELVGQCGCGGFA
jgi:hypothetical protein